MIKKISLKKLSPLEWRHLSLWAILVIAAILLLIWHLTGLTFGHLSLSEQSTLATSQTWHHMLSNPLYLPYDSLQWVLVTLGGDHIFLARLPSVIFALLSLWLFYYIARNWFNKPTVFMSVVLFATSLWLLHFGRLATPVVLYTAAPLAVVAGVIWLKNLKTKSNQYLLALVLALIVALTLYVPGIWLMWLALAVWQHKKLVMLTRRLPKWALGAGLVVLAALLVPLAFGFALHPTLIKSWFGYMPNSGGTLGVVSLFGDWPRYLLGQGPKLPADFWLGRQPLLAIFPAVALLFGAYFYIKNWRLKQAKLIGLGLACSLVLFVLSDAALLGLASGLVFLLVAAGIGYSLKLWRRVFPRNPIAYSVAVCLLGIITALTVIYTTRSYFVAWHYHPATKAAFSDKI